MHLSHDIKFAYRVHMSLSARCIYCRKLTSAKLYGNYRSLGNVSSGVRGGIIMATDRLDNSRFVQILQMKKKKYIMCNGSAVGIATGNGLDDRGVGVRVPVE
jgi:hypothetical protein